MAQGGDRGPSGKAAGHPYRGMFTFIGESVVESMQSRTKFSRPDDLPVFAVKRTIFLIRTQNFRRASRAVKSRQFLQ